MSTHRRTADRVLLGITIVLLASWPADALFDLFRATRFVPNIATDPLFRLGCFAAWAGVAWACRGPVPRGLALGAALVYATLAAALRADATALPGLLPTDTKSWGFVAINAIFKGLWLPAVPLLVFCRGGETRPAADRTGGRGTADWWLLGVTLTLLAWWPAFVTYTVCLGNPTLLAKLLNSADVAVAAGSFLAWGPSPGGAGGRLHGAWRSRPGSGTRL